MLLTICLAILFAMMLYSNPIIAAQLQIEWLLLKNWYHQSVAWMDYAAKVLEWRCKLAWWCTMQYGLDTLTRLTRWLERQ